MSREQAFERVLIVTICIIGGFIVLSMIMQFLLVWTGRVSGDNPGAWRPLFDLVAVLVGAVGGFITGQIVERRRDSEE